MTRKVQGSAQADLPVDERANGSNDSTADYQIPQQVLQQADAVAAAAVPDTAGPDPAIPFPPLEDVPPPPYSAGQYGELDISGNGFQTGARVAEDGRVDIKIDQINRRLTHILTKQLTNQGPAPKPEIPDGLGYTAGLPCPPLNIVIQVVGSRGDVQPFIALGQVLKKKFNHRVRIATHPVFKEFVIENGLEFFSIGGDPAELMAFMVKNPGLMPGMEALRSGDIGKKRKGIYDMINGCWRSCIEPGDGSGPPAADSTFPAGQTISDDNLASGRLSEKPFVADAIIANPPSFAHIHIAEKLGIPLHLMFTMPWSPTQAYPHPLTNILSTNTDQGMTNFLSYILVDLLTWQGIGDIINRFRETALRLEPISIIWAPGSLHRLRIPWTYAWSPALIPKPSDWSNFIDISGFFFLDLATNYVPAPDLAAFLDAGPPPVYIGFGSIVVDDPDAMTKLIFEAVKMSGQRALVSKGWGGLSAGELGQPDDVFMLGNCPHDWLFQHVSAVVHHGGAGTTAAGVKAGRPTVIVPFFGDQPFWGNMVHKAGAGPEPIHSKKLTARALADGILQALHPDCASKAKELSAKIQNENGPDDGADSFHKFLQISKLRCSLAPGRAAVWRIKRTDIRLSVLAATVLANANLIDFSDLKLYRSREYEVDTGPLEPISGGAAAIIGNVGSIAASVADFPSEVLRSVRTASGEGNKKQKARADGTPSPARSLTQASLNSSTSLPADNATTISSTTDVSSIRSPSVWDADDGHRDQNSAGTAPTTVAESTNGSEATAKGEDEMEGRRERLPHRQSLQERPRRLSSQEAGRITLGTAIGSAKATGNIIAVGLKSPLDFTMSLAKGFHNLPRLYNDTTVRQPEKVTDFQSGLRAAGRTFAYGFMDGIGGLVTQPLQGYKEEGGAGLVKGLVKGSLGFVVKPGAAFWGLPAYAMQGIYAEISKNFGKSTTNYIIAARMAQGYEDYRESSEGDRERIISAWHSPEFEIRYRHRQEAKLKEQAKQRSRASTSTVKVGANSEDRLVDQNGQLLSGFLATRHLSFDERKELARRRQEAQSPPDPTATVPRPEEEHQLTEASEAEFRDAIREAVDRTSRNNPQEDQAIENAMWASVRELQRPNATGNPDDKESNVTKGKKREGDQDEVDDGDAYQRAVAASVAEYKRTQRLNDIKRSGQESGVTGSSDGMHDDYDEDVELTRAITASLAEYSHGSDMENMPGDATPKVPEDDEEFRRAVEESLKAQSLSSSNADTIKPATTKGHGSSLLESTSRHDPNSTFTNTDHDDDPEFQEALRQSELESKQKASHMEKQMTEEDIVLEYVKKQSLAEEEYRRSKQKGQQQ